MYILECSNGSFYTGSTIDLNKRIADHFEGKGANHTMKYPPEKLVFIEEFPTVQQAFYREKQIQKWSRAKKLALIEGDENLLRNLAKSQRILKKNSGK